jgi:site-specific DNA recombinase
VVRLIFRWMGIDGCSLAEIGRRLRERGIRTQTGRTVWLSRTLWGILMNEAYTGAAYFNKTTAIGRRSRPRPNRGQPEHPRRVRSLRATPPADRIPVPVPVLIDQALAQAARERLAENRKRNRRPPQQARYLLQGLIVCQRCGYAFCGQTATPTQAGRVHQYYFCTGSMFGRGDRERVCWTKSVRMGELDAAVWADVRGVLTDPGRVEAEYRRRRSGDASGRVEQGQSSDRLAEAARRRVARLVDAFEDGLLDKSEFEPRIRIARERLARLEADAAAERDRQATEADLRELLGRLDEFARRVQDGLADADLPTRREIIRTLVKRVEVGEQEVRVVYKVNPFPFADGPDHPWDRGRFQDRVRRTAATSSRCTAKVTASASR